MTRQAVRWIYIQESLHFSKILPFGRTRAVVRVPAYIRGALRTTLPTSLVPALPTWGQTRPACALKNLRETHRFLLSRALRDSAAHCSRRFSKFLPCLRRDPPAFH